MVSEGKLKPACSRKSDSLCSMIFLLAQPVYACDCSAAQESYDAAQEALDAALKELEAAEEAFEEAGLLDKFDAWLRVVAASAAVIAAGLAQVMAWTALQLCKAACDNSGSGGCDSGGCG